MWIFFAAFLCNAFLVSSHLVWEQRCRNCRLSGTITKASDKITVTSCQALCEAKEGCLGIHYFTGLTTQDYTCEMVHAGKDLPFGVRHETYDAALHWDLYERVENGSTNLAWRLYCNNCEYEHSYPYDPIRTRNMQSLSADACKTTGQDLSAVVAEYNEATKDCRLKWGGNPWNSRRSSAIKGDYETYILLDPHYVGCFRDSKTEPAMQFHKSNLTPLACNKECSLQNKPFYAVQRSTECFCGDATTYGKYGQWKATGEVYTTWRGCSPGMKKSIMDIKYWLQEAEQAQADRVVDHWWDTKHTIWWQGKGVLAVFRTSSRGNMDWEKRCTDCRFDGVEHQIEGVTVSACQQQCQNNPTCFGISFGVGPHKGLCKIVLRKDGFPMDGKVNYDFTEDLHWDSYNLVLSGRDNLAWRLLCETCIFEHTWDYHPIERERHSDVTLLECQEKARELSATAIEWREDESHCNIKWGGNIWNGAGPHTVKRNQPYDTYVLIDPNYVGCFRDKSTDLSMSFVGEMTTFQCDDFCSKEGARYFGMQSTNQCSCAWDNSFRRHGLWSTTPEYESLGEYFKSFISPFGCTVNLRKSTANPYWEKLRRDVFEKSKYSMWMWWREAKNVWSHGDWANAVFLTSNPRN